MVKPFTIGYLRSTIIGDVISNIFSYSGKKVIRDNHLGDWGVQFGKIICAVNEYSSISEIKKLKSPYDEILRLYKFFLEKEKLNSSLTQRAEDHFQRLESKDMNTVLLWNEIRSILHNGLLNIYSILEISFDNISWESNVQDSVQLMVDDLIKENIAQISNGAVIVNLNNYDLSKIVLRKKNGSALYGARELATDRARILEYGKDIVIINEVGSDQEMYMKQIYLIEEMLGWFSKEQRYHLSHGMYRLDGMKMDSENKNYLSLLNVLERLGKNLQSKYSISKKDAFDLSLGSIRLHDLKNPHKNNIDFNLDIFTQDNVNRIFYVQGLMRKLSELIDTFPLEDKSFEINKCSVVDINLCRKVQKFPEIIESCILEIQCTDLTRYALELLELLEETLEGDMSSDTRNHLLPCTHKILKICFNLLGIKII
jgi:arginyl-tRNA synthetase